MAGDDDDTVLIPRPGKRAASRPAAPWIAAAVLGVALGAGGTWWALRDPGAPNAAPTSSATVQPGPGAAAPPAAAGPHAGAPATVEPSRQLAASQPATPVGFVGAPALPPLAEEAAILDRAPNTTEAYRFARQPEIVVLQFPTLAQQASTLNRAAALVEKAGFPRDRVVTEQELDRAIRAAGGTPDTFYYGHDYRAEDIMRFFRDADRAGLALTPGETWLRQMVGEWGWQDGTVGALISLTRDDPASGLDRAARATILRHELSHGLYFVNPAYAAYSRQFFEHVLTPAERDKFRAFLASEGYDTALDDLVVNETQAYLMHTSEPRFFNAKSVGLTEARLDQLRGLFLTGMPPGWLRDCTTVPTAGR